MPPDGFAAWIMLSDETQVTPLEAIELCKQQDHPANLAPTRLRYPGRMAATTRR